MRQTRTRRHLTTFLKVSARPGKCTWRAGDTAFRYLIPIFFCLNVSFPAFALREQATAESNRYSGLEEALKDSAGLEELRVLVLSRDGIFHDGVRKMITREFPGSIVEAAYDEEEAQKGLKNQPDLVIAEKRNYSGRADPNQMAERFLAQVKSNHSPVTTLLVDGVTDVPMIGLSKKDEPPLPAGVDERVFYGTGMHSDIHRIIQKSRLYTGLEEGPFSHGPEFAQQAIQFLKERGVAPRFDQVYLLKPSGPHAQVYQLFLGFLIDELRQLPFNNEMGETILMRSDAKRVVERLAVFLEKQSSRLKRKTEWDRTSLREVIDIFEGDLEVFKNEIYPGHKQEGIGYNVDLGHFFGFNSRDIPSPYVVLERYHVTPKRGLRGFKVAGQSRMRLYLESGLLKVDLDEWQGGVHLGEVGLEEAVEIGVAVLPDKDEDAHFAQRLEGGLVVAGVFDGLSGHDFGGRASRIAASVIQEELTALSAESSKETILEQLGVAMKKAVAALQENLKGTNAGTTATVAITVPRTDGSAEIFIANAGNSRAYLRESDGTFESLTVDNLEPTEDKNELILTREEIRQRIQTSDQPYLSSEERAWQLLDQEEQATFMFGRKWVSNILTADEQHPYRLMVTAVTVPAGSQLLLVTDGIHHNLTDSEIRDTAARLSGEPPQAIAQTLVNVAEERSLLRPQFWHIRATFDDLTAVVIPVGSQGSPDAGLEEGEIEQFLRTVFKEPEGADPLPKLQKLWVALSRGERDFFSYYLQYRRQWGLWPHPREFIQEMSSTESAASHRPRSVKRKIAQLGIEGIPFRVKDDPLAHRTKSYQVGIRKVDLDGLSALRGILQGGNPDPFVSQQRKFALPGGRITGAIWNAVQTVIERKQAQDPSATSILLSLDEIMREKNPSDEYRWDKKTSVVVLMSRWASEGRPVKEGTLQKSPDVPRGYFRWVAEGSKSPSPDSASPFLNLAPASVGWLGLRAFQEWYQAQLPHIEARLQEDGLGFKDFRDAMVVRQPSVREGAPSEFIEITVYVHGEYNVEEAVRALEQAHVPGVRFHVETFPFGAPVKHPGIIFFSHSLDREIEGMAQVEIPRELEKVKEFIARIDPTVVALAALDPKTILSRVPSDLSILDYLLQLKVKAVDFTEADGSRLTAYFV